MKGQIMFMRFVSIIAFFAIAIAPVWADDYQDTIKVFKNAGESGRLFTSAYGYAVFPTIAKGGVGVGGAFGKGRVYEQGKYVGDASVKQVSFGAQLGGPAYSGLIF